MTSSHPVAPGATSSDTVHVSLRIPSDLLTELDREADLQRRSRSSLIVLLLDLALKGRRQPGESAEAERGSGFRFVSGDEYELHDVRLLKGPEVVPVRLDTDLTTPIVRSDPAAFIPDYDFESDQRRTNPAEDDRPSGPRRRVKLIPTPTAEDIAKAKHQWRDHPTFGKICTVCGATRKPGTTPTTTCPGPAS